MSKTGEKHCSTCKRLKTRTEFNKDKASKDGLQYECKTCKRRYLKLRYEAQRAFTDGVKLTRGCVDCGYRRCAAALHFHHTDSATKEFCVGKAMNRRRAAVIQEINKCIVLCANCHAERHADERNDA